MHVEAIPAFRDNYIWLLYGDNSRQAWVVDPGEAKPVLERLQEKQLLLEGVLLTHHHPDHDGGIPALRQSFPDLRIIGGLQSDSIHPTERYPEGATIDVLGESFQLMEVPGHTLDHVAFYCAHASLLFCGDTLFAGGCGRLFEGSAQQMHHSLSRIAILPEQTLSYCAHEYTMSNLRFALTVEPDNAALQQRMRDTEALRAKGLPTVPSFLSLELATNPFLRCHEPSIMAAARARAETQQQHLSSEDPCAVFSIIRGWKDHF